MNKDYIYKRRLLSLAVLLEKLPNNKFDYGSWVGENWKEGNTNLCGTTACAFGWATTIPALKRVGLKLKKHNGGYPTVVTMDGLGCNLHSAEKAAKKVFGLNVQEFEYLFVPDFVNKSLGSDATAKQVAKHIRKFVKAWYK